MTTNPARRGRPPLNLAEELTKRTDRSGTCWPCSGAANGSGYVYLSKTAAHKLAWELADGRPVPHGLYVLHTCDNRRCVRNEPPGVYTINGRAFDTHGHLFTGTQADNIQDSYAKGTNVTQVHPELLARGERNGVATLTDTGVRAMRERYAAGTASLRELAKEYGVDRTAIYAAIMGVSWSHVPSPSPEEIKASRKAALGPRLNEGPCADCGTTARKRIAKGLCDRCYSLRERRTKGIGENRGSNVGNSKLTDADVLAIREARLNTTGRELARRYGVSPGLITLIQQRKVWAHI